MSRKKQVAALAFVALLVIAMLWWRTTTSASDSVAPVVASAQPEHESSPELAVAAAAAAASANDRAEVTDGTRPPIPARPRPPHEFALEFIVTDADDAPLAGASVFVAPRMQPLNRAGETDGEGRLTARWRGFVESMDVVVAASTDSGAPASLRLVHVQAAVEQRVALRAASASFLITFVGAGQSTELEVTRSVPVLTDLPVLGSMFRARGGARACEMRAGADGFADFVDPWMARCVDGEKEPSASDAVALSAVFSLRLSELGYAAAAGGEKIVISGVHFSPPPPQFSLGGRVLGPEDQPQANVLVRVRREGAGKWGSTRSDGDGNYQFEPLDGANYDLVAGDGDHGLARTSITGSADAKVSFDARLDRGRELHGRLLGREGQALPNWTVELLREDSLAPWIDFASTDDAGVFRIPSLPGGAFTLLACPTDDGPDGAIPLVIARNVWPTDEQQDFTASTEPFGGVRVQLIDEHDQPVAGGEVRVWRDDVERGRSIAHDAVGNLFNLGGQFPGTYRIEIGAPERGWMAIEQAFIKAGETLDLGAIRLPAPARVELPANSARPGEAVGGIFLRAGREVESLSPDLAGAPPLAIEIAAGDYEFARAFEGLARGSKIALRSGETQRVELHSPARRDDR
jgi:hypothetical protein